MSDTLTRRYLSPRMSGLCIAASLCLLFVAGLLQYGRFPVENSLPPQDYYADISRTARSLGFVKLSVAAALAVDIERYKERVGRYPVMRNWTACTSREEDREMYAQWDSLAGSLCRDLLAAMGPEGGTLLYRGGRRKYRILVKDAALKPAVKSVYPQLGRSGVYWGYGFRSF